MVMTLLTRPKKTVGTFVIATDGSGDFNCDGIADDVQIQAAIDALPATGGCIYMKEGTYVITATIVINKVGVSITGCGYNTLLQTTLNIDIFELQANTFHLEKMRLNGSGTGNYAIYNASANNIGGGILQDLWIAEFTDAIHLEYVDVTVISHLIINTISNDAIVLGYGNSSTGSTEVVIDGCRIIDVGRYGIFLNGAAWMTKITNNNIVGTTYNYTLQWGIYLLDHCDQIIITSNDIYDLGGNGGAIKVEDTCKLNIISSNMISEIRGTTDAMVITGDCQWNNVSANIFKNCMTSLGALFIDDNSDFNTIVANTFFSNYDYNVKINSADCNNNCVSGNHSMSTDPGAGTFTQRIIDLGTSSNIFNNGEW